MTRALSKRLVPAVAQFCSLPLLLLLAGCYSDPNIPANKRVQFPGDQPQTTGEITASPSPQTPVRQVAGPLPEPVPSQVSGGNIAIGDSLTITFSDVPPGGGLPLQPFVVKVGSDGTFTLPYNVIIQALGKTPTDLECEIRSAYVPKWFVNCTATVKPEERYFFVGGEVRVASRLAYTSHSMTVLRAITSAGGFTDFAKKSKIEVRRANGGKPEYVNYYKALKDPKLDLLVFPNDQIIVPRGL